MKIAKVISAIVFVMLIAGLVTLGVLRANTTKTEQRGKLQVAASYYPLYEFARQVGGDKVEVTAITPPGAEPHDYEPSPKQLIAARKAHVFIYNGANLEPWVEAFLPEYSQVAVKASDGISVLAADEAATDPHFWLDPILARQMIKTIRDGLIRAAPQHRTYFMEQAAVYTLELARLDQAYTAMLASCQSRTLITSHDAFSYLAKRYNLKVIPIAGLSPEEEPAPAKLAELTKLVKETGITHIFFESLTSPELAQTLARETGVQTALFDPIEGISNEDQAKGKNYLTIQRENLANVRTALACQ